MISIHEQRPKPELRTFEDAAYFIAALRQFKFFNDYEKLLSELDWLALGLATDIQTF